MAVFEPFPVRGVVEHVWVDADVGRGVKGLHARVGGQEVPGLVVERGACEDDPVEGFENVEVGGHAGHLPDHVWGQHCTRGPSVSARVQVCPVLGRHWGGSIGWWHDGHQVEVDGVDEREI